LEELKSYLRVNDIKILKENNNFYLVSERLDILETSQQVYTQAKEVIATLNLSFRLTTPDFDQIAFEGTIAERRTDGSKDNTTYLEAIGLKGRSKIKAVSATVEGQETPASAPKPSQPEKVFHLIEDDENFREAVRAFDADPKNFKDLYIAYETILRCNSASKKKDYKIYQHLAGQQTTS
jgi:hypothetical protein